MTQHEYDFLTSRWDGDRSPDGSKGAAWNQVFAFCRSFGWCAGFDQEGRPVLTNKGIKAIKAYQSDARRDTAEKNNRIDVV